MIASLIALALTCPSAAASALQLDFQRAPIVPKSLSRRGYSKAPLLENSQHAQYFINVSVGTPPQDLQLQFDTGSSDIWVPSISANACNKSGCAMYGAFNGSASSTFSNDSSEPFFVPYGTGSARGSVFTDTLAIAGTQLKSFTMGLAERFSIPSSNGVLGVGPDSLQYPASTGAREPVPGVLDMLVSAGVIKRRAFSVYLGDQESAHGNVLFGGIDTSKYKEPLTALALTKNATGAYDRYRVDLTAVTFIDANGISTELGATNMSAPAVLDTGAAMMYLPARIASAISTGLGAVSVQGTYFVECAYRTSNATLAFQFGGATGPTIIVPTNQLIGDPPGIEYDNHVPACILNVASGDKSEQNSPTLGGYTLGDSFIRNAYIVYDVDNLEIHVAQAVFNTSDSNIQDIPAGSGLPMVSSTATATATLLPTSVANESGATATATATAGDGDGSNNATVSGTVIQTAPMSPSFSLGVTATASKPNVASTSSMSAGAALSTGLRQLAWTATLAALACLT